MISLQQHYNGSPTFACLIASMLAYDNTNNNRNNLMQTLNRGTYQNRTWRYLGDSTNGLNNVNYRGCAIINENTQQIIIAHRGTELDHIQTWLSTNFPLVIAGNIPDSYNVAREFSNSIRQRLLEEQQNYTIYETGHSLGGMYAALNSHTFDSKAVTFDSPSLGHILQNDEIRNQLRPARLNDHHYINYVISPNIVNTSGGQRYGRWIRLFTHHVEHRVDLNLNEIFGAVTNTINLTLNMVTRYDLRSHCSLENIRDMFDPELNEPWLQAEILTWPNRGEYLSWWKSASSPLAFIREAVGNQVIQRNLRIEMSLRKCESYSLRKFLIPVFRHPGRTPDINHRIEHVLMNYLINLQNRFLTFFPLQEFFLTNFRENEHGVPLEPLQLDDYRNYVAIRDLIFPENPSEHLWHHVIPVRKNIERDGRHEPIAQGSASDFEAHRLINIESMATVQKLLDVYNRFNAIMQTLETERQQFEVNREFYYRQFNEFEVLDKQYKDQIFQTIVMPTAIGGVGGGVAGGIIAYKLIAPGAPVTAIGGGTITGAVAAGSFAGAGVGGPVTSGLAAGWFAGTGVGGAAAVEGAAGAALAGSVVAVGTTTIVVTVAAGAVIGAAVVGGAVYGIQQWRYSVENDSTKQRRDEAEDARQAFINAIGAYAQALSAVHQDSMYATYQDEFSRIKQRIKARFLELIEAQVLPILRAGDEEVFQTYFDVVTLLANQYPLYDIERNLAGNIITITERFVIRPPVVAIGLKLKLDQLFSQRLMLLFFDNVITEEQANGRRIWHFQNNDIRQLNLVHAIFHELHQSLRVEIVGDQPAVVPNLQETVFWNRAFFAQPDITPERNLPNQFSCNIM